MKYTDSEKRLIKRLYKQDWYWLVDYRENEIVSFLIKEVRRARKTYKQGYIDGHSEGWEEGREELL